MSFVVAYRLPWPPSVNHYYLHTPKGTFITKAGRAYRRVVGLLPRPPRPLEGRLGVLIECHPPDRRARDLDNLGKSLLDACQHAGYFLSDAQIDDLRFVRCQPADFAPGVKGMVVVRLWVIGGPGQ
jgi:crossover junction endodeoxyribonuclease RusA